MISDPHYMYFYGKDVDGKKMVLAVLVPYPGCYEEGHQIPMPAVKADWHRVREGYKAYVKEDDDGNS